VRKVEIDRAGRATGVIYFDAQKRRQRSAPRRWSSVPTAPRRPGLLFNSASSRFADGLANSSGMVGKNLMFNGGAGAMGLFEHPLNEYKSIQCTRLSHDFYDSDPKRGYYGGGGIDARFQQYPIGWALGGLPTTRRPGAASTSGWWGDYFNRSMLAAGHTTSLPVPTNNITWIPRSRMPGGFRRCA
jgi:hypothetical protein